MSVGHAARILEAGGIATVVIAAKTFLPLMEGMRLPRLLLSAHPMGRPLGAPGNVERQRDVILVALEMLQNAEGGGTIVEMPGKYVVKS